jgi:hypothetical protein
MKTRTLDLSTATTRELVELAGNGWQVIAASDSSALVNVSNADGLDSLLPASLGTGYVGRPFKRLALSWAAQAGVTVTLAAFGSVTQAVEENILID